VLGTLATAFILLPSLSLRTVVWTGVAVNVAVFALAALLARRVALAPVAAPELQEPARAWGRREWILPLALLAGTTSFGYEVLWTRLLSHLFGGTVYAFGTMLASFLTGIALGSAAAVRFARTPSSALVAFAASQIGVALASVAAFAAVDALPELALRLGAGGHAGAWKNAAVGIVVLLPGALFIGASFPLAVRVLARGELDASPASARVYAWNTVGAIAGAVGAGFLWIPALGYVGTLVLAATANLAIAAAAALLARPPRLVLVAVAAALAALLVAEPPAAPWRLLSTSALDLAHGRLRSVEPGRIVHFAAGRSSTVMLAEGESGAFELFTNGLPEAGIRPAGVNLLDDASQWLGGLPVLARPEGRTLLVIGLGGGTTLEAIAPSVREIDVIELEPEVVAANRAITERRAVDPLADPRVRIAVNDARGALSLTTRRWDLVVSQPSHPWTAGASHLFTREFFRLVREHLEPGGVFVQWMALDFVDEALLRSLVATLGDTFANVQVYWVRRWQAMLFAASDAPLAVEAGAARALRAMPGAFAHLGVHAPEDVAALLVLDEAGAQRFAQGAPVSTDARNLFQFRAPRALAAPLAPAALASLLAPLDPLAPPDGGLDALRLARRLVAERQPERAARLAASVDDAALRQAIEGLVLLSEGQADAGRSALRQALSLDPSLVEARTALVRRSSPDGVPYYALGPQDDARLEAVAAGWRHARSGNEQALAALDSELAAIAASDALYADALRLRARWRIESGEPARAREALGLLDALLPMTHFLPDVILRARASALAGDVDVALLTLGAVLRGLSPDNPSNALVLGDVREALADVPEDGVHAEARRRLADALIARRIEFGVERGR
jgi:spermidine synthase